MIPFLIMLQVAGYLALGLIIASYMQIDDLLNIVTAMVFWPFVVFFLILTA